MIEHYYVISILMILVVIVIISVYYSRRLLSKEVVTIAILSSLIALSRGAFFFVPQFKPMAALIMVSASVFGSIPGLLIGFLSAFLSNFFFGQGPWTPYQMLAFGLIGFITGFFKLTKVKAILLGFFLTLFVYGPILNLSSMFMMSSTFNLQSFLIMESSGFMFDLVHAISTVVFVYFTWNPFRKKLIRLHEKYHILRR